MAELSSENIENHPKSRDNNVTKSMAGGVGGASHSSKRSFDVAFLAGSDDTNIKVLLQNTITKSENWKKM